MGRVRLTCLPIVMTSQWSAAHQRKAHLKAQTCDVLQREGKAKADAAEHGRNREEPAHMNPEGRPNQRCQTWHGSTIQVNMDEPVVLRAWRTVREGTGLDHSSNAEIRRGEDGTPGQDPIPNAHGCIAEGVQTMALSDL